MIKAEFARSDLGWSTVILNSELMDRPHIRYLGESSNCWNISDVSITERLEYHGMLFEIII
jgi:hypothetical protein